MHRALTIRGVFVHTPKLGTAEILKDHLLVTDETGVITHFDDASSSASNQILQSILKSSESLITIPRGSFITPTFVDLHLHAPQVLYQGNGLHLPLMEWLNEYAFKAEERLDSDPELARYVYTRLASRLIQSGTGSVLLFGTIKAETNLILAQVMQEAGIRAFVGKLSMDISSRPSYQESSADASYNHERLVEPVLTPRFVPTCSAELLTGLGELSQAENLKIQSHMAESLDQVEYVRKERGDEDMNIFEQHGLLTARTIQAHCTFLGTASLKHVHKCGTAIAHCPLSNSYFSAEPFHLREALDEQVKVGLGTDIAGGYSIDIMSAMRHAVSVSRMRHGAKQLAKETGDQSLAIDWMESLYLATKGGAEALGLASGCFAVGAPFDAQQICLWDEGGRGVGALDFVDLERASEDERRSWTLKMDVLEKWWCLGAHENRVGMWIQGNQIHQCAK
ncbi:unnamed protein product [Mycena citricolor]|uniref:Amidohydrolase-related domain-containing protein n=1 Tax=Mycena citricolor TaxID=2018698 RepID=A0AAD2HY77_9AGAR|nr:unnamed protein product [Mycena citricolor]